MTWYREIEPLQKPFDMKKDSVDRAKIVFNIAVIKGPSDTFLEEIVKLLVNGGVGIYNTDIFLTSSKDIPDGPGPYLSIIETGGTFAERTHNDIILPAFERPTAQIVVRANSYAAARAMANAAYKILVAIRNLNVVP